MYISIATRSIMIRIQINWTFTASNRSIRNLFKQRSDLSVSQFLFHNCRYFVPPFECVGLCIKRIQPPILHYIGELQRSMPMNRDLTLIITSSGFSDSPASSFFNAPCHLSRISSPFRWHLRTRSNRSFSYTRVSSRMSARY